jgi:hypothetical protein
MRIFAPIPSPTTRQSTNITLPKVEIEGKPFTILTQALGTLPKSDLKRPLATLAAQKNEITRALELLFTGF